MDSPHISQHLALYRKWRPLTFDDVYGQAHITRALKAQVAGRKTSHAYLFTGTRGTGKTTCAKILARAVNCLSPIDGNPCNTCAACKAGLDESALDITEIDAASMSGVENIREIREEAFFAPTHLRMRVYIIDEVHMLSGGAFNALLKTLEEPPSHVLFILATTELHKVPSTILSRCQRYDFRRIPAEIIAERLAAIAEAEGVSLTPDAADVLAARGDGSFRDAISLLDRAMTGEAITRQAVEAALGLMGSAQVDALLAAILDGAATQALELFTLSYMQGQDMISLFDSLLSRLRDIYVLKATGRATLLLSPMGDAQALEAMAERCEPTLLEFLITCISDLLRRLTRTAIRRTDGEMCLLKMCLRHSDAAEAPAIPAAKAVQQPKVEPVKATPAPQPTAPATVAVPESELPWASDAPEVAEIKPHPAPEPEPIPEPEPEPEPTPKAEPDPKASVGDVALLQSLVAAVSAKVNSGVRTYLSLASARNIGGVLHIQVAEESLVFMDKPAVLAILNEGARTLGLQGVMVSDKPHKDGAPKASGPASSPVADILSRAKSLGVDIKKS